MTDIALTSSDSLHISANDDSVQQFVTMTIGDQLFGISVFAVQDVLSPQKITPIPLAPPDIAGALNLRGRIVTSIYMRNRLGLPPAGENQRNAKSIVVEHEDQLYSLIVDSIGDVLTLPIDNFSNCPENLNPLWQNFALGVYPLKERILIILDVEQLLQFGNS